MYQDSLQTDSDNFGQNVFSIEFFFGAQFVIFTILGILPSCLKLKQSCLTSPVLETGCSERVSNTYCNWRTQSNGFKLKNHQDGKKHKDYSRILHFVEDFITAVSWSQWRLESLWNWVLSEHKSLVSTLHLTNSDWCIALEKLSIDKRRNLISMWTSVVSKKYLTAAKTANGDGFRGMLTWASVG